MPRQEMPQSPRMLRDGHFWRAADAVICGDVRLGDDCGVWFGAVIRGDVAPITLGQRVNVQEHAVLHCDSGEPLVIGDDVTIGHGAVVHCLSVGSGSLVGIKSVLLGRVVVGKNCLIAAGAVLSPGTVVPDGQVVMGIPGRVVRPATEADIASMSHNHAHYVELARRHVERAADIYR